MHGFPLLCKLADVAIHKCRTPLDDACSFGISCRDFRCGLRAVLLFICSSVLPSGLGAAERIHASDRRIHCRRRHGNVRSSPRNASGPRAHQNTAPWPPPPRGRRRRAQRPECLVAPPVDRDTRQDTHTNVRSQCHQRNSRGRPAALSPKCSQRRTAQRRDRGRAESAAAGVVSALLAALAATAASCQRPAALFGAHTREHVRNVRR